MAELKTKYMGIELKNPVMAGASSLTSHMDSLKRLEDAGAGALVISSLFEEQIQLESFVLEEELHNYDNRYAEMLDFFPDIKHSGPDEHLMWVRKAKDAAGIPVIASLNAVNRPTWVHYAKLLEETGADGLELNFYATPTDFDRTAEQIEDDQVATLREVKKGVKIPISVKLSPFYTNPLNFIRKIDAVGVDGHVLFNRFFQPDIDVETGKQVIRHNLSTENDIRIPLRFAGILCDRIAGDICASTGIMSPEDVAKMLLAGASCVQVVSTLFRNKLSHMSALVSGLSKWMDGKGYKSIDSFRGKLSDKNTPDPWTYRRAQYVRLLLHPEEFTRNFPVT